MFSLADPFFWLNFAYFWIAVFLAFFIPGYLFLKNTGISLFQKSIISICLGIVLWGFQGFVFGYLNLRFASYLYLIFFFLLFLRAIVRQRIKFKKIEFDKLLLLIIILGVFVQLIHVWFTGIRFSDKIFFCCGDTSDSLFQIALTNQIVDRFPPFQPGMFGVVVENYHYWSNLVVAELIRVFKLPLVATQYQYMTVLTSSLLGLTGIVFFRILGLGKVFQRWLAFFLYFGSDFIYLIASIRTKSLDFTMSSLEDGARFLANPPRAFAIVILFSALSVLVLYLKKKNFKVGVVMSLLFGFLISFKVYIGLFVFPGLLILSLLFLFKKDLKTFLLFLFPLILSAISYLPVNSSAGGLTYIGLWRFENFASQEKLNFLNYVMAKDIYAQGGNLLRVFTYEIFFAALYLAAVFGTKLFGVFQSKKSLSLLPKEINIFLFFGIFTSLILGVFFQQTTGGANTFNFLVTIFIVGSIYTAITLGHFKLRSKLNYLIIFLIIILTIPRIAEQTSRSLYLLLTTKNFVISKAEIEAYEYIKNNTDKNSIILTEKRYFSHDEDSPYLSFLIDRPMYLSGSGILRSHVIDYESREGNVKEIFFSKTLSNVARALLNSKINYIVMYQKNDFEATESSMFFMEKEFENSELKVFKISKEKIEKYLKSLP